MTLQEWQNDPTLVAWLANLFKDGRWKALMDVLQTEHPKNYQNLSEQGNADRELGIIYGYDRYDNNLAAAARASSPPLPEPSFSATDETIEEDYEQRSPTTQTGRASPRTVDPDQ